MNSERIIVALARLFVICYSYSYNTPPSPIRYHYSGLHAYRYIPKVCSVNANIMGISIIFQKMVKRPQALRHRKTILNIPLYMLGILLLRYGIFLMYIHQSTIYISIWDHMRGNCVVRGSLCSACPYF